VSSFTKALILEFDFAGNPDKPYILREPFSYYTDLLPVTLIDVPAGYRTDFASIPRFFWRVLPPFGRYGKAAVIHDWLCDIEPKICDHITAVDVFDEAMAALGVGQKTRWIMGKAVQWFGPKFQCSEKNLPTLGNQEVASA